MTQQALPHKIKFTHSDHSKLRGTINRHNRRKFLKLSRLGRLMSDMVPPGFLVYSGQEAKP